MKRLLIATSNPGKLREITEVLKDLPITLVSLNDFNIKEKPQESGQTFEENALIKARFYYKFTGLATLADDGGFEIDALGGAPGVRSHRWPDANREAGDEELIAYTLRQLKGISLDRRGAQLRLVMAIVFPDGHEFTVEEKVRGIVPLKPSHNRMQGFPYRSLLLIPEINKFYNEYELTQEEDKKYNHRKRALEQLKPLLRQTLT